VGTDEAIDWGDDPPTTSERGYTTSWQRLSRALVRRHVRRHGWWCPGWFAGRSGHASRDLTVHHIVPLSEGGSNDPSNLAVICRSCNSREAMHRRRMQNQPGRGPADWWRDR
jgi:5-methylcytosine-specific restriction endonuclease McrA